MTTSDEFSLLAEAPKDRWGRYKISDPATGKERDTHGSQQSQKYWTIHRRLLIGKQGWQSPASFNEPIFLLKHQQR